MLVTYLITVYNKERYIANVIDSLKQAAGDFDKEYIFVNDGSTDNSLKIIQSQTSDLANVTIINHSNQGPSVSTNVGISSARGDYVHFVDGDDIIEADSTSALLSAARSFNCDVAFSLGGTYDYKTQLKKRAELNPDVLFVEDPLKELLRGKISSVRKIGSSGSLVTLRLLKEVRGCDESVFMQDFSLSLRCAKSTKFVRVNRSLFYLPKIYDNNNLSFDKRFEYYQSLLTIHNFMRDNEELCENYSMHFYRAFWSIMWKMNKTFPIFTSYIKSKLNSKSQDSQSLIELYKTELAKIKP
jgi:glycosyltransferase involved in cell wall biosynthesis